MDDDSILKGAIPMVLKAVGWLFSGAALLVSFAVKRTLDGYDHQITQIRDQQKADRETCGKDLTQHAVADAGQHDSIKRDLATEISRLYDKIDETRKEIKGDLATIVTLIKRND